MTDEYPPTMESLNMHPSRSYGDLVIPQPQRFRTSPKSSVRMSASRSSLLSSDVAIECVREIKQIVAYGVNSSLTASMPHLPVYNARTQSSNDEVKTAASMPSIHLYGRIPDNVRLRSRQSQGSPGKVLVTNDVKHVDVRRTSVIEERIHSSSSSSEDDDDDENEDDSDSDSYIVGSQDDHDADCSSIGDSDSDADVNDPRHYRGHDDDSDEDSDSDRDEHKRTMFGDFSRTGFVDGQGAASRLSSDEERDGISPLSSTERFAESSTAPQSDDDRPAHDYGSRRRHPLADSDQEEDDDSEKISGSALLDQEFAAQSAQQLKAQMSKFKALSSSSPSALSHGHPRHPTVRHAPLSEHGDASERSEGNLMMEQDEAHDTITHLRKKHYKLNSSSTLVMSPLASSSSSSSSSVYSPGVVLGAKASAPRRSLGNMPQLGVSMTAIPPRDVTLILEDALPVRSSSPPSRVSNPLVRNKHFRKPRSAEGGARLNILTPSPLNPHGDDEDRLARQQRISALFQVDLNARASSGSLPPYTSSLSSIPPLKEDSDREEEHHDSDGIRTEERPTVVAESSHEEASLTQNVDHDENQSVPTSSGD